MANIKNRKKLQLIQTIWDVMLYSQHFTFHRKLLGLVSRIEKSGTGDNNFGNGKGHFGPTDRPTEMTRLVTVDHLQSWSRIFRSDQTEMVRSIWCTNRNYRNFGLNGKRPKSFLFCFVLESTVVQSEMEVVLRCENYVQVDALTVVPWLQRSVLKIPNMK